ncbi:MAG: methionyl-tRNA formyltransferase [Thermodesulfobacteriaceae bacterium]|nr:methionyl-tRNA formyltransferase [Thermodesulfobacteriaceae bacterium]
MRIIIVGQGPFGEKVCERLINKGEKVVGIFTPPGGRGDPLEKVAKEYNIPCFRVPNMKEAWIEEEFKKLTPDLVILAFVTDILPERLLSIPNIGTICYHPSILPRHRGASAINWALIMGEEKTGLTIFWVEKGIDTGPILLQKEVEILPTDTAGSLYFNKLFPMGIEAIEEAVELIKAGKAPRIPQDDSLATYEPPCDDKVAGIKFNKSLDEIYNLIRGCDPQPGAYAFYKGKKIRFYGVQKITSFHDHPPGKIIEIDESGLTITVKGGFIKVSKFRIDKGEKIGALQLREILELKEGDQLEEA